MMSSLFLYYLLCHVQCLRESKYIFEYFSTNKIIKRSK